MLFDGLSINFLGALRTIHNFAVSSDEAVWGPYGHWSECSVTCGQGERSRSRECLYPSCWDEVRCDGDDDDDSSETQTESCTVESGESNAQGGAVTSRRMIVTSYIFVCRAILLERLRTMERVQRHVWTRNAATNETLY